MATTINQDKKYKSLIVTDMEAGPGGAILGTASFPSLMAIAKTKKVDLAYQMGEIAAKEALKAGYHWTFGPVVDVLYDPDSPITSYRAASNDPDEVIAYAGAYLKGLQDHGLIATLKHFPGDGMTKNDQHLTTAINDFSKSKWLSTYGKIYKTLINEGVKAIMIGHIALSAFDDIDLYGMYPPATQSKKIMTELLKHKLKFDGLIVSDAVEMSGFCGYRNLCEAAAYFLNGGGDLLLFMQPDAYYLSEMKKQIELGNLSVENLKERAYRILCFSSEYFEKQHETKLDYDPEMVAKKVVDLSTHVFRDRNHILPMHLKNKRIAHVHISNQHPTKVVDDLQQALARITETIFLKDIGPRALLDIAKNKTFDVIICSIGTELGYATNMVKLSGVVARNMMLGWTKYQTPVIFVDFFHPFIHLEYDAAIDTLIYTYGINPYTVDKVIALIHKTD